MYVLRETLLAKQLFTAYYGDFVSLFKTSDVVAHWLTSEWFRIPYMVVCCDMV